MCGLLALYSPHAPLPPEAALRGTQTLAHRGPDGQGFWQAPDGRVAFGHTRLSLVDTVGGAQPLASEDSQLHLIVNGEFYDYAAIQHDLRQRGHQLRTRSDSEIALHLYEEQGVQCLSALRGEFAFVLWDAVRQTLFAARDRFGVKPLFYAQVGGVLYLASEIKALLAAGVPAVWDAEAVYQTLHLCFAPQRTLFQGIRQVPPAHFLSATPAGVRLTRYWDIPYPHKNHIDPQLTETACIEQVRSLLTDAVRLRLQADVPVGCLLSGGLDSSTMLGLAVRHSPHPVTAFTIGFNHADYDESRLAAATARELGADFHLLAATDRDLADNFAAAVQQGEMVQVNAHGTARFLLSRAMQQAGCKAVLAGEGADELFAGYAFVRAALPGARPTGPRWLAAGWRLLQPYTPAQKQLAQASPALARLSQVLGFAAPALASLTERLGFMRDVLAPTFVRAFRHHDPYAQLYLGLDQRWALLQWEPAKQMLYLWLRTLFANYHMAADRLDMAHAVEVRLPFLDHPLVEYASQIPVALLAKAGQNKFILRAAAQPFIPPAVYQRVKKPFLAPPAAATPGNPLHDFAQDTLRGPLPAFFDRVAVGRLLDSLPQQSPTALPAIEGLLMGLVSLTILQQHYFAGAATPHQ